jgi:hypothetical protein
LLYLRVELLRLHELVDLELDVFHVVFDRVELLDAEQVREEHGQLEAGEDHGHDTQEDGPKVDGHAAAALAHDEGGNGRDRTCKGRWAQVGRTNMNGETDVDGISLAS